MKLNVFCAKLKTFTYFIFRDEPPDYYTITKNDELPSYSDVTFVTAKDTNCLSTAVWKKKTQLKYTQNSWWNGDSKWLIRTIHLHEEWTEKRLLKHLSCNLRPKGYLFLKFVQLKHLLSCILKAFIHSRKVYFKLYEFSCIKLLSTWHDIIHE